MKFEAARIHFLSDVFVAVAVNVAQAPFNRTQRDWAICAQDLRSTLALGNPKFNYSYQLVKQSQLAGLLPVGIPTCYVYINYLFLSLFVGHIVNYMYWVNTNLLFYPNKVVN